MAIMLYTELILFGPRPFHISKRADGSKRQIISEIDLTSLQVSEHGHGTIPSHYTTHHHLPYPPPTGS